MFNSQNFAKRLVGAGAVGFRKIPKELASGKLSHFYVDGRKVLKTLALRDLVVENAIELMKEHGLISSNLDAVLGVPEGANKLGDAISEKLIREGLIKDNLYQLRLIANNRKTGVEKDWVGGEFPNKSIVFEDTITTGGKALEFVNRLGDLGVEINDVVGVVDRLQLIDGQTAKERFESMGLRLHSLTTAQELLPEYLQQLELENPELAKYVREIINLEYRNEYEEAGRDSPIEL